MDQNLLVYLLFLDKETQLETFSAKSWVTLTTKAFLYFLISSTVKC